MRISHMCISHTHERRDPGTRMPHDGERPPACELALACASTPCGSPETGRKCLARSPRWLDDRDAQIHDRCDTAAPCVSPTAWRAGTAAADEPNPPDRVLHEAAQVCRAAPARESSDEALALALALAWSAVTSPMGRGTGTRSCCRLPISAPGHRRTRSRARAGAAGRARRWGARRRRRATARGLSAGRTGACGPRRPSSRAARRWRPPCRGRPPAGPRSRRASVRRWDSRSPA